MAKKDDEVLDYVNNYCIIIKKLEKAKWDFINDDKIRYLINGLPPKT